jgi:hypothetical protein
MTGNLAELLEEEFKLKRLQRIVDQTAADLRWKTPSESEAEDRMAETRRRVLDLFPDGGELFERIYRPRFERIFRERRHQNINL